MYYVPNQISLSIFQLSWPMHYITLIYVKFLSPTLPHGARAWHYKSKTERGKKMDRNWKPGLHSSSKFSNYLRRSIWRKTRDVRIILSLCKAISRVENYHSPLKTVMPLSISVIPLFFYCDTLMVDIHLRSHFQKLNKICGTVTIGCGLCMLPDVLVQWFSTGGDCAPPPSPKIGRFWRHFWFSQPEEAASG